MCVDSQKWKLKNEVYLLDPEICESRFQAYLNVRNRSRNRAIDFVKTRLTRCVKRSFHEIDREIERSISSKPDLARSGKSAQSFYPFLVVFFKKTTRNDKNPRSERPRARAVFHGSSLARTGTLPFLIVFFKKTTRNDQNPDPSGPELEPFSTARAQRGSVLPYEIDREIERSISSKPV